MLICLQNWRGYNKITNFGDLCITLVFLSEYNYVIKVNHKLYFQPKLFLVFLNYITFSGIHFGLFNNYKP